MSRPTGMPFYESLKGHLPDGAVIAGAPPEERLRGRVKVLLRRITGANNKEFLIKSYADHVVKFPLAGIRSTREEAEKRTKRTRRGIYENQ